MRGLLQSLLVGIMLTTGAAWAQNSDIFRSPILTIDQDRLFEQTRPGADRVAALEAAAAELAAENRRIEAELAEEERVLADERADMSVEEFTERAEDFNQRVQMIRAQQDEKARAFNIQRDEARQAFFAEVGDILSQIVVERGAVIVLDLRDVFLSADQIDITDDAITRVNAAFDPDPPQEDGQGDGTTQEQAQPEAPADQ